MYTKFSPRTYLPAFLISLLLLFYNLKADDPKVSKNDLDGDGVKNKYDKCPNTPSGVKVDETGCPMDADKDGVADYLDKCPNTAGLSTLNGCPDKDKDGIADGDDDCPEVPGLARFKGCPDSDGDGVEDAKDKCPNQAGLDRFSGCPDTDGDGVPDTQDKCPNTPKDLKVDATGCAADADGDGVPDSQDKCPDTQKGLKVDASGCAADADNDGVPDSQDKCTNTEKGVKVDATGCPLDTDGDGIPDSKDKCPQMNGRGTPDGCPPVKAEVKKRLQFAARGINFTTGKAVITPESFPMLNEIVSILKEYTDYNLKIGGHTDNVGNADMNFKLSQARVDAVKTYLANQGVSLTRMEAVGYGSSKPIASNSSEAGRAKNRRVELELFLK